MYAIMRSKKHKTGGSLAAALQHMYRERETPNSDATVKNLDAKIAKNTRESLQLLHSEIKKSNESTGRKLRKDAVVAVEYLFTASPEFFDPRSDKKIQEFTSAASKFLAETYPDGVIIAASVHLDETTPHVSVFITPTTKNDKNQHTFNARKFLGGKKLLSEQQDKFFDAVKHMGLRRGQKGSKATHQQINKFYSNLLISEQKKSEINKKFTADIQKNASFLGSKKELLQTSTELAEQLAESMSNVNYIEMRRLRAENARLLARESDIERRIADEIREPFYKQIAQLTHALDQKQSELYVAQKRIRSFERLTEQMKSDATQQKTMKKSPKR